MRRSFKSIKEEMLKSSGPSKPLFLEMERYCLRAGLTLEETFFNSAEVHPALIALWLEDKDFVEWMRERRERKSARCWFYKDQPDHELMHNAVEVMSEQFVAAPSGDGFRLYRIQDHAAKIVQPVSMTDPETEVMRALKDVLLAEGCVLNRQKALRLMELFMVYGSLNTPPRLCAQPGEDSWCLHRIPVTPDPAMAFPATMEFLERLNDREAFAAWLYGVASGRYRGRQVLWVQGDGEDGKSTFIKAFSSLFGRTAGSIDGTTIKHNAQFAASLFVDKRFVIVADNKNPNLLMTEIFKSLANPGADPVVVNQKYGKVYSAELEAHVAILSNYEPNITGERHNSTRTLWINISEFTGEPDPRYVDRVRAELPGFLAYGEKCYAERCRDDYLIEVNDSVKEAVAERISDTNEPFELILEQHFAVDPCASMTRAEFRDILKDDLRLSNQEICNFKHWLFTTYGVRVRQGTTGIRRYHGIRKGKPSDIRSKIKIVGGEHHEAARG